MLALTGAAPGSQDANQTGQLSAHLMPPMEKQPVLRKSKDRVTISTDDSSDDNTTSAPAFEFSTDEEDAPVAGFDNLPWQICISNRSTKVSTRSTTRKRQKGISRIKQKIDMAAAQFALRMATILMISSIFVLVDWPHGGHYPDGMWVLVSVLFVGWFPSLDAASVVIEKITQRLVGTYLWLLFNLGFSNKSVSSHFPRELYAVLQFWHYLVAGQFKIGPKKIIRRYAYAKTSAS
jgi:hypothetical protein